MALPLGADLVEATKLALPFPRHWPRKRWVALLSRAGLPPTTRVHDLRAAVASQLAASAGLKAAQLVLGHADSRTTLRYVRPGEAERGQALASVVSELAKALKSQRR